MKIKIAVADTDNEYVLRLLSALEMEDNLSLSMFSDKNAFVSAMASQKFDIVIADPSMLEDAGSFKNVKLTVALFDEEYQGSGKIFEVYKTVRKYQRASSIYKEVLGFFAEVASASMSYSVNKKCNIICVYSPAGGSGKTTVAISITDSLANRGVNALYLNFEPVSSYAAIMKKKAAKGIGDLFASLDTNINYEMKVESLIQKTDKGMLYFEDFDNLLDVYEVTSEDIEKLITIISGTGLCEYIVIDMGSEFSKINRDIMDLADKIIMVEPVDQLGSEKMNRMFSRRNILRNYEDKMQVILNRASNASTSVTGLEVIGKVSSFSGDSSEVIAAMSRSRMIDIEKVKQ